MQRHLSYANVAATLALVFSMTGGAMAAKHYLINSTAQINPKVVKALRGDKGATGPAGLQGKEGPAGKGAEGPAGKEGPSGKEGIAGRNGVPGATKIVTRYGPNRALTFNGEIGFSNAACLQGEAVTGGGFEFPEGRPASTSYAVETDRASVVEKPILPDEPPSYPPSANGGAATGWVVRMLNDTGSALTFRAYAQCASP